MACLLIAAYETGQMLIVCMGSVGINFLVVCHMPLILSKVKCYVQPNDSKISCSVISAGMNLMLIYD